MNKCIFRENVATAGKLHLPRRISDVMYIDFYSRTLAGLSCGEFGRRHAEMGHELCVNQLGLGAISPESTNVSERAADYDRSQSC